MIVAVLPITPLANGMRKWGWLPEQLSKQAAGLACSAKLLEKYPEVLAKHLDTEVEVVAAIAPKKPTPPGTPYRSVDPTTGRVWGAPNAGGLGQCFYCPNRAMATSNRCESCWRLAKTSKCEPMKESDLEEVQSSLKAALGSFSGSKLRDTEERLQHLYSKLQAGEIHLDVQPKLIQIAGMISSGKKVEANKEYASLSAEHWEEHKYWLMAIKRLISKP
jgi:hypothetical protein